ncbi:hypothetical protein EWM64_g2462 [Hericium alpestre]|uniref:Uncharacterized protein n=1 Tax=Hericium alpestre TaxID=135208 RepID=A0A4Z0A530_9AGAM|nr:hypothetical protein EWM64_g2462 [Hericium alpestre]
MFTISLMKAIDIRSESAVKLLAEFLDMDTPYVDGGRFVNAEHFAHEIYSYIRSPYRDLANYDASVQVTSRCLWSLKVTVEVASVLYFFSIFRAICKAVTPSPRTISTLTPAFSIPSQT